MTVAPDGGPPRRNLDRSLSLADVPYDIHEHVDPPECSEEGCVRSVYADGLCKQHRDTRWHRRESELLHPPPPDPLLAAFAARPR